MATTPPSIPPRDDELFAAFLLGPLTADQVLQISQTWPHGFPDRRSVNRRLHALVKRRLLNCYHFYPKTQSAAFYYTLTPESYRYIAGGDTPLPKKTFFREIAFSNQRHAHLLSELLVQTTVLAHNSGLELSRLAREDSIAIGDNDVIVPDAAFDIELGDRRVLSFYLEADNNTEPVRARSTRNGLLEKLRMYHAFAETNNHRFRVLFVTTGSPARVNHILDLARELAPDPHRWLVYAATAEVFLETPSLFLPVFRNHAGQSVSLVDKRERCTDESQPAEALATTA